MGRVSIIILLLSLSCTLLGVPAYPYPVEVKQPDGSKILLILRGDESFRFRTNVMGDFVVRGEDGFYRPTFTLSVPSEKCVISASAAQKPAKSVSALIIPAEFKDVKFTVEDPESHFENMINGQGYSEFGATGSAREYFEENLAGMTSVVFDVSKKVGLSQSLEYYGANVQTTGRSGGERYDVRVSEMIREACAKVDQDTDFSKYDYVFVYYAGYSESEGGDTYCIWPASIDISASPIEYDGARITNVGCGSELRGNVGTTPSGIGAFCHEFGHILGLPDLYDTDYDNNGRAKGMWGTLSLMDYGCYNNQGRTPPYFNAIEREILGEKGGRLTLNTLHHLKPVHLSGDFYRVDTSNENEYFLIEARQESGWDTFIGGEGMLIYHIDKSDNQAGMITASVRWENNLINTYSGHECADLVEAIPAAVNVRQIFFPGMGNVVTFATLTEPHFVDWDMRGVGLKLTEITLKGEDQGVSFMVSQDNDEILMVPADIKVKCDQRMARLSWDSEYEMNAKWGVRWRKSDGYFSEAYEKVVSQREAVIDNLRGGDTYECEIYHIGYKKNGDTVSVKFKTFDITSPFPYIQGLDRNINTGDTLKLKVYNLNEVEDNLVWYLNGEKLDDNLFCFTREGENKVSVRIKYLSDGSEETITKQVMVSRRPEYEEDL